jgi:GNAT superfamily N-acetyltransferase
VTAPQTRADTLDVPTAIEVFARAFAAKRSRTHPYHAERVDGLWVLRDGPRRNGKYRNEEWIALGVPAGEVDRVIRRRTRGRYSVCAFDTSEDDEAEERDAYRALGYRLARTEPLMVHDLARLPRRTSPAKIERVRTQAVADELAGATRGGSWRLEHLAGDAPVRQYVARVDGKLAGWVASVPAEGATYCDDMFVEAPHRRRGIASALMARLLRDDRAHDSARSVLLASHTGALLYPQLGYTTIGTLLLYNPPKKR